MEAKLPYLRGRRTTLRPTKRAPVMSRTVSLWPVARVALCLLLVALLIWPDVRDGFAGLKATFGDTDDATRLLQVREFAAGAGWYDLVLARIGGATPLVSHWSRLIDAPLAGLIVVFSLFANAAEAELAARAAWPALLLLLLFLGLSREGEARGGMAGAVLVLLLAATTLSSVVQFRAGRIDHHNVMILATLAGLLMFARALTQPKLGAGAGALFGLALVIGYEPMAFILPMAAAAALAALIDQRWMAATRAAATALTATLGVGLLTAAPPSLWHLAPCDAIGLNLVALAAVSTLGLYAADAVRHRVGRLAVAGVFAAVGLALAVAINPACMAGPFAGLSVEARALWLADVSENQPVWVMAKLNPVPMIAFAVLLLSGLIAAVRRARAERTADSVALLVAMVWLALVSAAMMKFVAYAGLLAAFCLGLGLARAIDGAKISALIKQAVGVFALNQVTVAIVVSLAGATVAPSLQATHETCATPAAVAALASLPKGLVVAPIDVGPALTVATSHDVLAAPYHRIGAAIVANEAIYRASADEAILRLKFAGATYLAACLPTPAEAPKDEAASSLMARLRAGQEPASLTRVDVGAASALRVWRVTP